VGLQGGVESQKDVDVVDVYGGDTVGVYTPVFSGRFVAERLDRCGCAAVTRVKNPSLSSAIEGS